MKSAPTIEFDYRPSRRVGALAAVVAATAALAPWLTGLPWSLCAVLSLLAVVLGAVALHRFRHPPFRRIARRDAGWLLVDAAGDEHAAELKAHARLGALITLDLRLERGPRFRALLAPDNLDADTRRRLVLVLAREPV
ncbi:MAG: hypothetical protein GXC76_12530 [Rhodanobacteraceae bacterium]|jgi:hypothetical protein|nr:hypothetical protein [Rhodanobacteraceae bacterium]